MHQNDKQLIGLLVIAAVVCLVLYRRKWRGSGHAFGTARWAIDDILRRAGMLAGKGLILARTLRGSLLWLPQYVHILLVGGTGSGKGVSVIIPILLSNFRNSIVAFDPKGDLYATTSRHRKRRGQKIIRLAPFAGGDCFNPLDTISSKSPKLVDSARAMAEALVYRQGTEPDPHWNDKSVLVITALIVLVLLRFNGVERSLNTVQEIASDADMVRAAAEKLREIGGIPGRLGNQMKTLFEKDGGLTKEGAGVLSTVSRHLSFLDSALVAKSLATSTFRVEQLLKQGTTLYLQIEPDQLEAAKGLLRCWISTFIRVIGQEGSEQTEVLFLLDEASALGSLSALEEALVRGRSAGVRLLLAYQSDSQVQAAFANKKTLLYDNCSTQIYLGASSYETAERISKMLGERTQVVESYGENNGRSWQVGGMGSDGQNVSRGTNLNFSENSRSLLKPEEVLNLDPRLLICFVRGVPPILARRVLYYADPFFGSNRRSTMSSLLWWGLLAIAIGLIAGGIIILGG
jgi:type IV secretion system protein VirD4